MVWYHIITCNIIHTQTQTNVHITTIMASDMNHQTLIMAMINSFLLNNREESRWTTVLLVLATNLLPHVSNHVFRNLSERWKRLSSRTQNLRTIETSFVTGELGEQFAADDGTKNQLLTEAILLYLESKGCFQQLTDANFSLKEVGEDITAEATKAPRKKKARVLKGCELVAMPAEYEWLDVGRFGKTEMTSHNVRVRMERKEGTDNEDSSNSTVTKNILYLGSVSVESIDCLVEEAFEWYNEHQLKREDSSRFSYSVESFRDGDHPVYTRQRLSDNVTFDSLFFPEKDAVIKALDEFMEKTGKYAVKGRPHKMGFLLHGPPGTGKSTFAKALAEKTGRSMVHIHLGGIRTNKQFRNIFHGKARNLHGQNTLSASVGYNEVIYILEEIDASSDIVKKRACQSNKKNPRGRAENCETQSNGKRKRQDQDDALCLSTLLEAFDGIIDTPGLLFIMTTNHKEVIDDALIRHGRVDKQIELSYLQSDTAIQMLEHYLQLKLTEEQCQTVQSAFDHENLRITPVQLLHLVDECEGLVGVLNKLNKLCGLG